MDGDLAIYQAAFNYAGSTEFKVANEDWSKEYLLNGGGAVNAETGYSFAFSKGGSANNSITLPQGLWSVLVKVDRLASRRAQPSFRSAASSKQAIESGGWLGAPGLNSTLPRVG